MALSELDMMNLWAKQLTGYASQWERLFGFGYAVEAEVRKDDEALIRNFVAAIKLDRHDWEDWPEDSRKAFEALRAAQEGKR